MTIQPENLGRWMADVDRLLRTLSTSTRAANTSIADDQGNELVRLSRNGIEVLDANGTLRARLGFINDDVGYGVSVFDSDGQLRFEVNDDGYRDPWIPHAMIAAGAFTPVTGGAFAPIYQGQVELITHGGVSLTVVASTDVGTTGQVRLKNAASGATTSAVSLASGDSISQTFQWLHGTPLGSGPVRFDLEARRTGGAGNLNLYQPYTLAMADPLQCTATGL